MADAAGAARSARRLLGAGALAVAAAAVAGDARAESQGGADPAPGARQGQVILNPEPDYGAPSPLRRAQETLAVLEPGAARPGPDAAPAGCPQPDGWSVVVVRGEQAPEVVRGHMITVMPPGC